MSLSSLLVVYFSSWSNLSFHVWKLLFVQTFEEAVEMNNSVPQGLSSSIFTRKPEVIFKWIGWVLWDCIKMACWPFMICFIILIKHNAWSIILSDSFFFWPLASKSCCALNFNALWVGAVALGKPKHDFSMSWPLTWTFKTVGLSLAQHVLKS